MRKEWLGQVRIYLLIKNHHYSYAWINLQEDGSLSFGLLSKTLKFTEWGSAVVQSGAFTNHVQTLPKGIVDIEDAESPHVTFHPPPISQKYGVAHMIDAQNRIVDEWELNWFPVRTPQLLLCVYTGNIFALPTETNLEGRHEIVKLPSQVQCLRMELIVIPKSKKSIKLLHSQSAVTNIHGVCPNYVVSCHFYNNPLVDPALYIVTDTHVK